MDVDEISEDGLLRGIDLTTCPPLGPRATVLIAGDICMAFSSIPSSTSSPRIPWRGLDEIVAGHGLRIANLECPLTLSDHAILKAGPCLRAHPASASIVRAGGFDVVGLANNHIRDYGSTGVLETIASCESAGLQTVGAGESLDRARPPLIVTVDGLRIGILAVAENEFGSAGHARAGGNPFEPLGTQRDVFQLKRVVDAVLVLFHGGAEGYRLPSPNMVRRCRSLVDAGADAVVCSHTHVPSGVELHDGVPIAYGTGNFFFDPPIQSRLPEGWHVGYCVSLSLGRHGVWRFALVPYRQVAGQRLVELLDDTRARALVRQTTELSATIKDEDRLAECWSDYCVSRRSSLLGGVLGLSRVERALVRRGSWPFWRIPRRRLPSLLNMIRCESHHDALITLLELELRDDEGS